MISVHREYRVSAKPEQYAHVEINPVGKIDVELKGVHQHYVSDFEHLSFSFHPSGVAVECQQRHSPWTLVFDDVEAQEMQHLVEDAQEAFEILMRDL